jgi:trehalose/maltose hydrolase-like predicted phosphorylase
MDASQTKTEFIFVGAMFAGVWAATGWLALLGGILANAKSLCDVPKWLLIALLIQGVIFSVATIALIGYRRRLLRSGTSL